MGSWLDFASLIIKDQEKAISAFTDSGIEFTGKVRHFIQSFAMLHSVFAKDARLFELLLKLTSQKAYKAVH